MTRIYTILLSSAFTIALGLCCAQSNMVVNELNFNDKTNQYLEQLHSQGKLLCSQYLGSSKRFDLSEMGLPGGTYIAELFYNGNSQSIKLIKRSKHK